MAEYGAHLTATANNNKPSIFVVLAQDNLASGLRNAFLYLTNVLVENEGNASLFWLRSWFDEVYLLLDLLVQSSHLRAYNASFAERFYGLERFDPSKAYLRKLSSKQEATSLLLLVSFPYLKNKLDTKYTNLRRDFAENKLSPKSWAHYFLKTYPTFCFFWELTVLMHQVTYAVGKGSHHSPLLRMASLQLRNYTKLDDHQQNVAMASALSETNLSWLQLLRRNSWMSTKWMAKGLGVSLSVGAFFLQFIDYCYSREDVSFTFSRLPIPPPPLLANKPSMETMASKCLICNSNRRNDTVLSTTGFVFCYSCIRTYVIQNKKCPVTGYPSTLDNLVKIYPPDDDG